MNLSIERWTIRVIVTIRIFLLIADLQVVLTMSKKSLARLRSLLTQRYSIEHVTLQPEIEHARDLPHFLGARGLSRRQYQGLS